MPRTISGYKVCSFCKENKPVSEFGKQRDKFDGLEYRCLVCSRARKAKYKEENRDKVLASMKEYNARDYVKLGRKKYKHTVKGKVAIAKINHKRREAAENAKQNFTHEHYSFLLRLHLDFRVKWDIDNILTTTPSHTCARPDSR